MYPLQSASLLIACVCFLPAATGQEGLLDPTFGAGGKVVVPVSPGYEAGYGIAVQPDGKIVVCGEALNGASGSNYDVVLLRINPDGTLDAGFGGSGTVIAAVGPEWDLAGTVVLQPDGKIVVGGQSLLNNSTNFLAIRFQADGSLDNSFGNGGIVRTAVGGAFNYGWHCELQADGKILVVGPVYNGADFDFGVVRYQPNGTLDNSFGNGGKVITPVSAGDDYSWSCAIQPDGKILLAGNSLLAGTPAFALVRYHPDGTLDGSFGNGGKVKTSVGNTVSRGRSVAVQPDGKILLGGSSGEGPAEDFAVARYLPDGSLDPAFGTNGIVVTPLSASEDKLWKVLVQPDGKILASGHGFSDLTGFDFAVVRYRPDGSLDAGFGNNGIALTPVGGGSDFGLTIALQADGKIVMTGAQVDPGYDMAVIRLENSFFSNTADQAEEPGWLTCSPNPFHSTAQVRFQLPRSGSVNLAVYDAFGRKVAALVDENLPAGRYERIFDAAELPTGLYLVRLSANRLTQRTLMVIQQ